MKDALRRIFPTFSKAILAVPPAPGVEFSTVFLGSESGIQFSDEHTSASLDTVRLHRVAAALAELNGGALRSTPIDGIQFSRGIPRCFESQLDSFPGDAIRKSPRFFSCYWKHGTKPFLMSTLLVGDDTSVPVEAPPADFREFNDAYFLSEIFGIADLDGSQVPSRASRRQKAFAIIMHRRPCVVFLQVSSGTGEMLDGFSLSLDEVLGKILRYGSEGAACMAAVQLHQAQGIPLPARTQDS